MSDETISENALETMRDIVKGAIEPTVVEALLEDGSMKFLVHGRELTVKRLLRSDLETDEATPFERRGTAQLQTVDSLIAHTLRFKDDDSTIFADADRAKPSLTTVFDYHKAGADGLPRWGRHRARFCFPLSDAWKAWTTADRQVMSMVEFARFLEDNVTDVLAGADGLDDHQQAFIKATGGSVASPSTLLALSISLKVNESSGVKEARNLTSGEAQIEFNSTHETSVAGDVVRMPSAFIIALPVFKNAPDFYRVLARLRYRKTAEGLKFWFELWRTDPTFDTAFREACEKVANDTALPVFFGAPEA